jgi:hypothetical protein
MSRLKGKWHAWGYRASSRTFLYFHTSLSNDIWRSWFAWALLPVGGPLPYFGPAVLLHLVLFLFWIPCPFYLSGSQITHVQTPHQTNASCGNRFKLLNLSESLLPHSCIVIIVSAVKCDRKALKGFKVLSKATGSKKHSASMTMALINQIVHCPVKLDEVPMLSCDVSIFAHATL